MKFAKKEKTEAEKMLKGGISSLGCLRVKGPPGERGIQKKKKKKVRSVETVPMHWGGVKKTRKKGRVKDPMSHTCRVGRGKKGTSKYKRPRGKRISGGKTDLMLVRRTKKIQITVGGAWGLLNEPG